jgi:hypothetical protein
MKKCSYSWNASNAYKYYIEESVPFDSMPVLSFKQFLILFKSSLKVVKVSKDITVNTFDFEAFYAICQAYQYRMIWAKIEEMTEEPETAPETV